MTKRQSGKLPRPASSGRRWTSFVAEDAPPGKVVRGLHEQVNPRVTPSGESRRSG